MIYSPDVLFIRTDEGAWVEPMRVDVLTSPAVNAGSVRAKMSGGVAVEVEIEIERVMRERMKRVLCLFGYKGVRNIVLGSFGTGAFG